MADTAVATGATGGTGAEVATMAGGKRSRWLAHVKKTMKAHKGKSLKQVLKMAKKTYKGGALSPADYNSGTPKVGGRKVTKKAGKRKH